MPHCPGRRHPPPVRQLSSDFPIHASTQMSVTSEAGVHFAEELGASVVVLARECSLKEVH